MENRIACSVKEAAAAIGVCENTLRKMMAEGLVAHKVVGGRRFVNVDSLRKLMAAA